MAIPRNNWGSSIDQGSRPRGGVKKVGPGCQNGKFITVGADLNILKVYEFSIPSRQSVSTEENKSHLGDNRVWLRTGIFLDNLPG